MIITARKRTENNSLAFTFLEKKPITLVRYEAVLVLELGSQTFVRITSDFSCFEPFSISSTCKALLALRQSVRDSFILNLKRRVGKRNMWS